VQLLAPHTRVVPGAPPAHAGEADVEPALTPELALAAAAPPKAPARARKHALGSGEAPV
jgi:hypothetical protein